MIAQTAKEPPWLAIARAELGAVLLLDPEDNPRILEYLRTTTFPNPQDETPWCSAFVNWCVQKAGLAGTRSAAARTWLYWGVGQYDPPLGSIVVMWRIHRTHGAGHVGFLVGATAGTVDLLGGNQHNEVCVRTYPRARVLANGFRWPKYNLLSHPKRSILSPQTPQDSGSSAVPESRPLSAGW